ncbi:MAG: MYXO-CTERM sorting domain-containing protein [Myxococcota bacterium]|nr:MYXO-CTERM sorting domain-containing protein [Myxococcota bacterium]
MRHASFAFISLVLTFVALPAFAQDDDVASRVDAICCGANCCLIGGSCFSNGDVNPDNSCQTCDVSGSQTAWTDMDGCTPPDSGVVTPPADSGTGGGEGGGGCSASPAGSAGPLAFLGLLGALFFVRRRR